MGRTSGANQLEEADEKTETIESCSFEDDEEIDDGFLEEDVELEIDEKVRETENGNLEDVSKKETNTMQNNAQQKEKRSDKPMKKQK